MLLFTREVDCKRSFFFNKGDFSSSLSCEMLQSHLRLLDQYAISFFFFFVLQRKQPSGKQGWLMMTDDGLLLGVFQSEEPLQPFRRVANANLPLAFHG